MADAFTSKAARIAESLKLAVFYRPDRPWPTERGMTFVVTDNCIKCKYMDCVEVCPVDCFYEGENMLVIHPDECIDCGVCEPECPAEAIVPDTQGGLEKWLKLNAEYAPKWPNITIKRDAAGRCQGFRRRAGKTGKVFFARARHRRLTPAQPFRSSGAARISDQIHLVFRLGV